MEFDNVIVVEPATIVEEAVEGQGLRELYVALTRPTQTLVVVHARPLPPELQAESPEDSARSERPAAEI
jgi:ATP-dependent exoDNAse (exonuclease V) beta subunit